MRVIFFVMVCFFVSLVQAQDVFGKWRTVDKNGESKCVVKIFKEDYKVYGKIVDILKEEDKGAVCTKCEGEDKNKPVLGFVLIRDLEKEGKFYKDGTIFDPEHGEEFRCRIAVSEEDPNVLQVRGYLSFLYSTQYWERVQ